MCRTSQSPFQGFPCSAPQSPPPEFQSIQHGFGHGGFTGIGQPLLSNAAIAPKTSRQEEAKTQLQSERVRLDPLDLPLSADRRPRSEAVLLLQDRRAGFSAVGAQLLRRLERPSSENCAVPQAWYERHFSATAGEGWAAPMPLLVCLAVRMPGTGKLRAPDCEPDAERPNGGQQVCEGGSGPLGMRVVGPLPFAY